MRLNRFVVAMSMAASLSACASFRPPPVVEVQAKTPPAALMQDTQHAPRPPGNTVADLAKGIVNERGRVDMCNADKAGLRGCKRSSQTSDT